MNLGHPMAKRRTRIDQVVNSPADVDVQTPQRAGESLSIARAFGPAERVFAVYSCWSSCCSVAGCSVCVYSEKSMKWHDHCELIVINGHVSKFSTETLNQVDTVSLLDNQVVISSPRSQTCG